MDHHHVLIKNTGNKSQSLHDSEPLTIIVRKGPMITAETENQRITRNSSYFKMSPEPPSYKVSFEHSEDNQDFEKEPVSISQPGTPKPIPPVLRRSKREVKLPSKFSDYQMK